MNRLNQIHNKTVIALPLFLALNAFSFQSQAGWLDQGADLLKSFQESQSSSTNTTSNSALPKDLSTEEIQKAFKQALTQGSETVVNKLSLKDGFNADPKIHIPLPDSLKTVQSTLNQFGMGKYMDDVETKLNRAAEAATPQAKALFLDAIKEMSFDDVKKIYEGPKDSATQYLKSKTAPSLKAKMAPIVENSLNEVGAISAYDKAISKYKNLPFVPDVKTDLLEHVVDEGMNGMFYYIAQEEAAIRKDPIKQSTELLKKVFGN
ncbi:hypothetical protein THMIRHAM_00140 [Thiomicrorhabdus immobilis]|uniref:DUF4197 domain-containing protein n=1 Tax=Thiomicrorhabdus immobilis TaxID=2791037 RepID=A0ABN6CUM5_9GAMM|nr:DUF4197 domain-containing protein [Thiomicrorhabdus immobilis]BCN92229.1 hypothetical protein THMIRHAM_00140 [Thiomicrorhabdus immobilis]